MNFLAHAYLSGTNKQILLGNFIADAVKGSDLKHYSGDVLRGIELHRAIDHFMDNHPLVQQGKKRLYPNYHKYAPVIMDMYYDHFLAIHWNQYSPVSLKQFSGKVYRLLARNYLLLPSRYKRILPYMIHGDWLGSYATIEGIGKRLTSMAQNRTRFLSNMEHAERELRLYYDLYASEFHAFIPEIKQYIQKEFGVI